VSYTEGVVELLSVSMICLAWCHVHGNWVYQCHDELRGLIIYKTVVPGSILL